LAKARAYIIQHLLAEYRSQPEKRQTVSVSDVSVAIGSKLEIIKQIKTALQEQFNTLDSEPSYPYRAR
jgi:hypothetical protein